MDRRERDSIPGQVNGFNVPRGSTSSVDCGGWCATAPYLAGGRSGKMSAYDDKFAKSFSCNKKSRMNPMKSLCIAGGKVFGSDILCSCGCFVLGEQKGHR